MKDFSGTNNFATESVVLRKQMFNFILRGTQHGKFQAIKTVNAETDNFSNALVTLLKCVKLTKTAGRLA